LKEHNMDHRGINRREFLASGAAAALLAGATPSRAAEAKPDVVIVRDKSRSVIKGFQVDATIAKRLVDKAVMTLAGEGDLAKAWRKFVDPNDKVAVKFNGLFRRATTHPQIIRAVTDGLLGAGVKPENITLFDRADKDIRTAGLNLKPQGPGVRVLGTGRNYGPSTKAGPVTTSLSNLLLEADVLINVPILKSHVRCGITGALKNHLGTVPNAGAFHNDYCSAIADLNALDPIKQKTRLCIADALYGLFDGGPQFRPNCRWDYCGVIASADPVALDATFVEIIKAERIERGLKPHHNDPKHIARAAELGLGQADLKRVRRLELEV